MRRTAFPSEHHRRLNVLAGAWDTTITTQKPDGSAGDTFRASDKYAWMPNGHFLVHEVDGIWGEQRVQSTEIFGVDAASGEFFSRSYDPDGSTNDFTSSIDGLDYTINGNIQRFHGRFSDDGLRLTGEWKQLIGGDWKPLVAVLLEKRS